MPLRSVKWWKVTADLVEGWRDKAQIPAEHLVLGGELLNMYEKRKLTYLEEMQRRPI